MNIAQFYKLATILGFKPGGGGAATTAATLVAPQPVAAGSYPTPLMVGSDASPPRFFNKKRNLGIFTTYALAQKTLTGGATGTDETSDAWTGNTPGLAYPANNGTSPLLTVGSGGAFTIIPSATALAAQDLTNCNVYIAFRVLPGGAVGPGSVNMGVRLYTGATVNPGSTNYLSVARTNWNPTFEWQILGFNVEDLTAVGTATLGDITQITHAAIRGGGTTVSTQIEVGQIFYCPKQLTKGAVVLAFDDCRADTWTQACYEMDKRGFVGTLFPGALATVLRPATDQFQLSVSQLQKMVRSKDWQCGGQAWTTEDPTWTVDTAMSDMAQLRGFMRRLALWGGKIGSFFSNYSTNRTEGKPAFQVNFPWGMRGFNIGADGGITAKAVLPETFPIADPNYITALGIDLNANSLAALTTFLGYVATGKALGILVFHAVDSSNSTQFAKFTGILDYLDANRATIEVNVLERFFLLGYANPL